LRPFVPQVSGSSSPAGSRDRKRYFPFARRPRFARLRVTCSTASGVRETLRCNIRCKGCSQSRHLPWGIISGRRLIGATFLFPTRECVTRFFLTMKERSGLRKWRQACASIRPSQEAASRSCVAKPPLSTIWQTSTRSLLQRLTPHSESILNQAFQLLPPLSGADIVGLFL
jgi:hypothetical protein